LALSDPEIDARLETMRREQTEAVAQFPVDESE
jgi:hypothetical protein